MRKSIARIAPLPAAALLAALLAAGCEGSGLEAHRARQAAQAERADLLERLADPAQRTEAAGAITARRDEMMPLLIRAAQQARPELQEPAVALLGELRAAEARPALEELATRSGWDATRAAAATALARIGDAAAAPPLLAALPREESALVRRALVAALGELADPRAFAALEAALRDPADAVRIEACDAVARSGDERAVPALIARYRALPRAAGRADSPIPLVPDSAPRPSADLPGDYAEPCAILRALGLAGGTRALAFVWKELRDSPSVRVRRTAAETLGRCGDARLAPALVGALRDPDPGVFDAALDGLELLTGVRLEDSSTDPAARRRKTAEAWEARMKTK